MLGEHRTLHVVSYGHFSVAHEKREPVVLEGKMEPTEKAESGVEEKLFTDLGMGGRERGGRGREVPQSGAVHRRMLSLSFTTCMFPEYGRQHKNQTDETEITQKN